MDLKCPNVLLADTRNQGVHKDLPVLVFLPISVSLCLKFWGSVVSHLICPTVSSIITSV